MDPDLDKNSETNQQFQKSFTALGLCCWWNHCSDYSCYCWFVYGLSDESRITNTCSTA
ncbi:unnamed protein product [Natator depressus]